MLTMTKVTGRGADLLAAIRARRGEWLTRVDLAEATGKRQLSPNDRHWLDTLEHEGLIEIDRRAIDAPVGFEWIYRAKA